MKTPFWLILLSFLIMILLLSSGYLALQNLQLKNKLSALQMQPSTPTNSYEADWKIYTNPIQGYSINYPKNWTAEKACVGGIVNDTYICLKSPDLELNPVPSVIKGLLITIAPKGSSFFTANVGTADFCKETTMSKIKDCFETTIGDQKAIRKEFSNFPFIDVAILQNNQITFVIRLQHNDSVNDSPASLEPFNQILSTFKFLENKNTNQFCGGIAGIACPAGFTCQLEGTYPDAGGTCVTLVKYSCPTSGWVDCMPGPDRKNTDSCSPQAMNWYQTNCPDFQGAAY